MTLTDGAERTRLAIYTHLAARGMLPSREALSGQLGITLENYDTALTELAETRNVVLKNGEVEMAHPFATRSFGFSVMGPHTLWWGGCAWDSFAIPNLVPDSPEVLVATTCPACATPHAWTVTSQGPPEGDQVAHFLTPTDRIWPDAAHACDNQLIFCSEDCVNTWLTSTGNDRGYVMLRDHLPPDTTTLGADHRLRIFAPGGELLCIEHPTLGRRMPGREERRWTKPR